MPDFKLFDEAKKAREAAAKKASEISQQASGKTGEIRAKAAAAAAQVRDNITDQVTEAMDAGFSKVSAVLQDLNFALPVLREAGYPVDSVNIGLGLPPKITVKFSDAAEVSEERFNALLEENEERKLTILMLKSLSQARRLQSKIKLAGLKPQGLSVDVGLIPEIAVKFG